MNDFVSTALVVIACFAIGVVVGIISVIAMASFRSGGNSKPPSPPSIGSEPPVWSDPTDSETLR
jgi:hypothetical protein